MVSELDKNTIEFVGKIQGKINYDETKPISVSDLDAKLLKILGNNKDLIEVGITDGLKEGKTFEVSGNSFKIVKVENDLLTGFNGAIIQRIVSKENPQVLETILWADGSKGFNNIFTSPDKLSTLVELGNDWGINDLLGIGSGEIFPQLQALKNFAEDYGVENINTGIGISMMGVGMGALALTKGFENINFRTYSGCVTDAIRKSIRENSDWGLNDKNGSNLETYLTPGEPLTNILKPFQGSNKFFMKENTDKNGFQKHGAEAYINDGTTNSNYYKIDGFNAGKFPVWTVDPLFETFSTGTGIGFRIKFTLGQINSIKEMANVSKDINVLLDALGLKLPIEVKDEQYKYIFIDNTKLLDNFDSMSYLDRLIDANPSLKDQHSDDKTVYIIKENERITLPQEILKSIDISDMFKDASIILKDGYTKPDIPLPDGTDVSLPSHGETVEEEAYIYTTRPQMLSKMLVAA